MSVIVSVSGMQPEWDIIKQVPGVSAVYGAARDNLAAVVPMGCSGLVSFGVCGGLDPRLKRGTLAIADKVVTAAGTFATDQLWTSAVAAALEAAATVTCELAVAGLSDPHVWATDPASRATLFARTGCGLIDNESYAVAQFAAAHTLPFVVLRAVSDESDDTVLDDPNEITPSGGFNILVDIRDFISDPALIIHEAIGFEAALAALRDTVAALGPGLRL